MTDSLMTVFRGTGDGRGMTRDPGGHNAGRRRRILPCVAALFMAIGAGPGIAQAPGTTDMAIFFGQSAPSSGTSADIGKDLRLGIEAAFNQINLNGGVGGKMLYLRYLDDSYIPNRAVANVRKLLGDRRGVFGLIGSVGAPSTTAIVPIVEEQGIPLVAPVTGLNALRDRTVFRNVINLRPSYQQEADTIVRHLAEDRSIKKIGLLYQDDSFGRAGLEAITQAAEEYGMELVGRAAFPRNTTAVKSAVFDLTRVNAEAVVIIGTYEPVAVALKWALKMDYLPVFITFSQVGGNALANALDGLDAEVFMTQILPDFASDDDESLAASYMEAIDAVWPGTKYGYVSFEGYLAGRLAAGALERCGSSLSRDCFTNAFLQPEPFVLDDLSLAYGEEDNQGIDDVYLTAYDPVEGFLPVRSLNDRSR